MPKYEKMKDNFEELMDQWDPTTHRQSVKKLPIFGGRKYSQRKIVGFTYVDEDFYNCWSHVMWIKCKNYVKMSITERNLNRLGVEQTKGSNKSIFLHKAVLGIGDLSSYTGDHINSVSLDNRKSNLRIATHFQNSVNKKRTKNKNGFKGVRFDKTKPKPYTGQIMCKGKYYASSFRTKEEAARWYDRKAIEFFGEFAATNFPREDYDN